MSSFDLDSVRTAAIGNRVGYMAKYLSGFRVRSVSCLEHLQQPLQIVLSQHLYSQLSI